MSDSTAHSKPRRPKSEETWLAIEGKPPIVVEQGEATPFDLFPSEVCDSPEPFAQTSTLVDFISEPPVTATPREPQRARAEDSRPVGARAVARGAGRAMPGRALVVVGAALAFLGVPRFDDVEHPSPIVSTLVGAHDIAAVAALPPTVPQSKPSLSSSDARADEARAIQDVLLRFQDAMGTRDAVAARAVWPSVTLDRLRLEFARPPEQNVVLDECRIRPAGRRATAACSGATAFEFRLHKIGGRWTISSVS